MEQLKDNQAPVESPKSAQQFKGYSLSELRYQRALTALKREYAKEKTIKRIDHLRHRSVFSSPGKRSSLGAAGGLLSKAATGLNYADYAMLGFSLFSSFRKVRGFFKKKK